MRSAVRSFSTLGNSASAAHVTFGTTGIRGNPNITAAVFGATGNLARSVMAQLGGSGVLVYFGNRGCHTESRHLKPLFELGNLGEVFYSIRDEESIRKVVQNADIVINLIGKHYETKHLVPTRRANGELSRVNFSFHDVHVLASENIARIAKEEGVPRFLQISSIASAPNSPSEWARTKYEAEQVVRSYYNNATIVRPAPMYGPRDRFLNWYAAIADALPGNRVPLLNHGKTLLQPVAIKDVSNAIYNIVMNEAYDGFTYDLAGPKDYTIEEIARFVYDITNQSHKLWPIGEIEGTLLAHALSLLPFPLLVPDHVELAKVDQVLAPNTGHLTFQDLEMTPALMEREAFQFLHRFRRGGHFTLASGYH